MNTYEQPIGQIIGFIALGGMNVIFSTYMIYLAWKQPDKLANMLTDFLEVNENTAMQRVNMMAVFGPVYWIIAVLVTFLGARELYLWLGF